MSSTDTISNEEPTRRSNPFAGTYHNDVTNHAARFHARHLAGTVALDLFQEGVRLAQVFDPAQDSLGVTILVTACAAITQGWQQSTINASSLRWQSELRQGGNWENRQLLAGLIDAAPWLSGSLIGTWLSDPLQEALFGRRRALFVSALFCTAFALATARSKTWVELLVFRMLLGIGIGAKASVAPVFAAEAAPDHLRGRLLLMWQLFDAFGIFVGFVCVWIVDMNWRILLGTAAVPTVILLFLVFLSPESPRFYIRRKIIERLSRLESQKRLRNNNEESDEWLRCDIYQDEEIKNSTFRKRIMALWINRRNRRACFAAFIVMASQQMCGVNVLAFYSSALFERVGNVDRSSSRNANLDPGTITRVAWLNFGFGLANFIFTIPAYWFIDEQRPQRGRRLLLLVSLAGMFATLVAIRSFYFISGDRARLGLISVFTIVIFLFFYGIGAGPVPFVFCAEVFPFALREIGMSFSVMINLLGLGLLVLFVPVITQEFGANGNSVLLFLFR
ncbi:general substrate transporter [Aspergillus crustosus]